MSYKKKSHQLNNATQSRRRFIKTGLIGLGGLGLLSAIPGCSTFDEIIFEDHVYLKDQVMIIGGGISGLFLAYKLKQIKTEFHLFEGSSFLGGRIRSQDGLDFGASLFNQTDDHLKKISKEFNLKETSLSKNLFYFDGGAEKVTSALKEKIAGLMPYRSLRLRWKLVEIKKLNETYELVFETPQGRRLLLVKKIALTVPPNQWNRIHGLLDLPEMKWATTWLKTLAAENIFKMTTPVSASQIAATKWNRKTKTILSDGDEKLSVLVKNLSNNMLGLEFELSHRPSISKSGLVMQDVVLPNTEKMMNLINETTKLNFSAKKLKSESFFNWSSVDLIRAAYFKNSEPLPIEEMQEFSNFQVFGDYSSPLKPHTVEGALLEADRVSSLFI